MVSYIRMDVMLKSYVNNFIQFFPGCIFFCAYEWTVSHTKVTLAKKQGMSHFILTLCRSLKKKLCGNFGKWAGERQEQNVISRSGICSKKMMFCDFKPLL